MNTPWPSADPLGEALHFLRMTGVYYCRSEFSAPWGLCLPPLTNCMMLHIVTSGACWLTAEDAEPLKLEAGDFALVLHGAGHTLASVPGVPAAQLFKLPREQLAERYEALRLGGNGPKTTMLCAVVSFDHPAAGRLIQSLPSIIGVAAKAAPHSEWTQSTVRLMVHEAGACRPGGETVTTRLADILVIQAIRSWIERAPEARTGWLGALHDRQIGTAIVLIHRDPTRSWTVAALAAETGMSRSAFAARFTQLVGQPAIQYATHWRMQVALGWLAEEGARLPDVARRLGNESEAAFGRTFKKFIGTSPGIARRTRGAAAAAVVAADILR
jgi:AraC-like DNA-binding protein